MKENQVYIKRFNILALLLILSFVLGIILLFKPLKKPANENNFMNLFSKRSSFIKQTGIAVIQVYGVIQFSGDQNFLGMPENGVDQIVETINEYSKADNIKGLILRINSPGGTIGSVQELYNALQNFRKKENMS